MFELSNSTCTLLRSSSSASTVHPSPFSSLGLVNGARLIPFIPFVKFSLFHVPSCLCLWSLGHQLVGHLYLRRTMSTNPAAWSWATYRMAESMGRPWRDHVSRMSSTHLRSWLSGGAVLSSVSMNHAMSWTSMMPPGRRDLQQHRGVTFRPRQK